MHKTTRIGIALVLFCFAAAALAAGPKAEKPSPWSVRWQWEGEPPPQLRLSITNKSDAPVELKDWQLTGRKRSQLGARLPSGGVKMV